jgi:hypothetical protein
MRFFLFFKRFGVSVTISALPIIEGNVSPAVRAVDFMIKKFFPIRCGTHANIIAPQIAKKDKLE